MKNFRGPVPLTDSDYAAVRRSVLAKLEPRRTRFSIAFRLAFAAVVVTFAVLITPRPSAPIPMTVPRANIAVIATPTPVPEHRTPYPVPPSTQHAAPSTQHPVPIPPSTQHAARSTGPRVVPPSPLPPIRLEIQTSDPDVRIIWIANQTVSTEETS